MLGHHGDDIAENLLMRIARGSGITGLAGLRPVHRVDRGIIHVRPLLDMDRSTIHGVLQAAGVPWREDSSNAGDRYVRNRVRRLVIPAWRAAVTHDPVRGAIRSRTLLEEDAVALDTWLRLLVGEPEKTEPHSLAALKGKPKALIRRAVIRFLRRHGLELSLGPKPVETLIKAVATGEQCRMSGGPSGFITCCDSVLQYRPLAEPATWRPFLAPVGSFVFFPDGGCLAVHMLKVDQKLQEQILRKEIDPDREAVISWPRGTQQVLLRRWAPGDRLRPLGAPGERKLQDVFGDRRIPPAERKRLPLVFTVEGELLWVPGVPPAESFKIEPRTRHALRLTYIGT
jgi:tRNA(Ile)-lysidine synthase